MESWTVTLTDSLTVTPMEYLLMGKPTGYWTDCQMANPKEKNLGCCLVKYSENRMANRLANRMVISLECLRWDSLKANPMVTHLGWHLG